jgi:hypothetical protein
LELIKTMTKQNRGNESWVIVWDFYNNLWDFIFVLGFDGRWSIISKDKKN